MNQQPEEAAAAVAEPPLVVAVGSSADGINVLTKLVGGLPAEYPGVVMIVQHMSPHHRSRLAPLLGRSTGLVVKEAARWRGPPPGYGLHRATGSSSDSRGWARAGGQRHARQLLTSIHRRPVRLRGSRVWAACRRRHPFGLERRRRPGPAGHPASRRNDDRADAR